MNNNGTRRGLREGVIVPFSPCKEIVSKKPFVKMWLIFKSNICIWKLMSLLAGQIEGTAKISNRSM